MLKDEILKEKLKTKLEKLDLNEERKNNLVSELNLLSNIIIDSYLESKH